MKQKITWWAADASSLSIPDENLGPWHVSLRQNSYAENSEDMLKFGYVFVCEQEVEFFMPKLKDRIGDITKAIEGEIQRTRAEAELKCRDLNASLQNLLALSYEGEGE